MKQMKALKIIKAYFGASENNLIIYIDILRKL